MAATYTMTSKILVYQSTAAWRFLVLPQKEGAEIKERFGKYAKGWRSIPVTARIGNTEWRTSIFPDSKLGTYLLPLKASVRKAEQITDTEQVDFSISI